ncbi:DUF4157 domain-containing protein [Aliinostoc sp. HNIBRCY26]|uniref:eCIS core domain-containing protein n=1 Tax=Aliinostoc sp. HNIBRCY26 TaxID=3418997 RepID=UPI003D078D40
MYSRVQRTGKKADDSSTNQFAPRPFKVESTAQDDGNDKTVVQSKALPDYKKSCLLTNIEILRPGGNEPPLQPKLEIQPQWEDARESYEPQGVKSGGDFLTINRNVIQNKEQPTDYKTQSGISWVLGKTRGATSKPPAPPLGIQTKLTIGEPGDKYEQEADRVAADVVQRINAPQSEDVPAQLQSKEVQSERIQRDIAPMIPKISIFRPGVSSPPPPGIQMKLSIREPGEEREPTLDQPIYTPVQPLIQRVNIGGMAATPDVEAGIQRARGGGQPLADSIREPMEQAFGADFSEVRVHTDAQADQLNQSIQAKAFTTGQDVFFRQGVYEPGSRGGQELLAHELTHVVQQSESTDGTWSKLAGVGAKTLQRMSIEEYDELARTHHGMTLMQQLKERSSQISEQSRSTWEEKTYEEVRSWLETMNYERILKSGELEQWYKSLTMVVQQFGQRESFQPPPSIDKLLGEKAYLFRGTTLDKNTGKLYTGNEGSTKGTPTTPSPIIAAIFASKGAKGFKTSGKLLYAEIGAFETVGFKPPDVLSGTEQEVTVNQEPSIVNELFLTRGGIVDLESVNEAFKLMNLPYVDATAETMDGKIRDAEEMNRGQIDEFTKILSDPAHLERWREATSRHKKMGDSLSDMQLFSRRKSLGENGKKALLEGWVMYNARERMRKATPRKFVLEDDALLYERMMTFKAIVLSGAVQPSEEKKDTEGSDDFDLFG